MHVDTVDAAAWWARPRGGSASKWIEGYQSSLNHRHRLVISGIVKDLQPETLLEVGCHCGPNLVRLGYELPQLSMIGIDVNAEAIEAGKNWIAGLGLSSRIQLHAGRVPERTSQLPSGCVDVVLSCYALAYLAPIDLDAVLYELGRLATKAIVLAEPQVSDRPTAQWVRSLSGYSEWQHNYVNASRWIGTWRGMTLQAVPVSPPVDKLNAVLVARRGGTAS